VRNLKKRLKTHFPNGPIYPLHRNFPKQMHDLRAICVSLRGKFQLEEIISYSQTVHSLYKYMRKFKNMEEEIEKRIIILSLLYIIYFLNFFSFQME
jgi:hypothetical protein